MCYLQHERYRCGHYLTTTQPCEASLLPSEFCEGPWSQANFTTPPCCDRCLWTCHNCSGVNTYRVCVCATIGCGHSLLDCKDACCKFTHVLDPGPDLVPGEQTVVKKEEPEEGEKTTEQMEENRGEQMKELEEAVQAKQAEKTEEVKESDETEDEDGEYDDDDDEVQLIRVVEVMRKV